MRKKQEDLKRIHTKINHLQAEIEDLDKKKMNDELINKFEEYLNCFCELGSYNKKSWPIAQTQKWWYFFAFLGNYEFATSLVSIISNKLLNCSLAEKEPLEFIKIELLWNITNDPASVEKDINKLRELYPYNLEFTHTAAHILIENINTRFDAIKLYRKCIDSWGKERGELIHSLYNIEIKIFRETLENEDYLNAEKQLDFIISYEVYKSNPFFNNTSLMLRERLRDRKFTEATAQRIEREMKNTIILESENQNKKSIEQLGIFSAIITFIITAAASAFNSEQSMTPLILIAIGLILILFLTTISLLHFKPKSIIKDFRCYLLAIFCGLTIYTVNATQSLEQVIEKEVIKKIDNIKPIVIVKEEEVENPQKRTESTIKKSPPKIVQDTEIDTLKYVMAHLFKLKPVKVKSLTNEIKLIFQFQGGISDSDVEGIISELQKRNHIIINNNNVSYP